MKIWSRALLIGLFAGVIGWIIAPLSVSAQSVNCSNPGTQLELNICSARDFEDADAALNALWKRVRRETRRMDQNAAPNAGSIADAILNAQRAWVDYRIAQCSGEREQFFGGTMAPMVGNMCSTRMTRARITELRNFLEGN